MKVVREIFYLFSTMYFSMLSHSMCRAIAFYNWSVSVAERGVFFRSMRLLTCFTVYLYATNMLRKNSANICISIFGMDLHCHKTRGEFADG